jgi:hypothetical protein
VCSVLEALDHARRSCEAGQVDTAVERADLALHLAEQAGDAASASAVGLSAALVARIFGERVGDLRQTVRPARAATSRDGLSSREAFLLSRVDGALRIDELLQVAAMPRSEALRRMATLLVKGLLSTQPLHGPADSGG